MADWNKVADDNTVQKVAQGMESRGFEVYIVGNGKQALEKLQEIIPERAEVMTGSSTTLDEIDFSEYLKSSDSKYTHLSQQIWAEDDDEKRADIRRKSLLAEYFVASANAITEDGQIVAVDNTGSRVGAFPFAAKNLVLVIGTNKITKDLDSAMKRIKEYVFPQESERLQKAYGVPSGFGKWVIVENEVNKGRIKAILVQEALGF